MTWGVESHIIERFGQAGVPREKISLAKDTYYFASPGQNSNRIHPALRNILRTDHECGGAAQQERRRRNFTTSLWILPFRRNKSKDVGTLIPATFMRVTVAL
jgi:hypothetical protein